MSWEDRIKTAAYTSPSGERIEFIYENLAKQWDKKGTAWDFADADGTYIQDLGRTGRRLPMRFIFAGENYDVSANAFELALAETGPGVLDHPLYGSIPVVPMGTVERRDNVKSAAGQAVISVTMWETTGVIYPTAQGDAAAAVAEAIEDFNTTGAAGFESNMSLSTKVEQALAKNSFAQALNTFKNGLQTVADTQEEVSKSFDAVFESINDGIDTLIGAPLTLAFQTSIMIGAPGRALSLISDKLEAYGNLARDIFGINDGDGAEQGPTTENQNDYYINSFYAQNAVSGSAISAANNDFQTRTEVIASADAILTLYDELTAWQDVNTESLDVIDTGESYQALQRVVALVTGFLVEISFTLLQERKITTVRQRNLIELTAELYGDVKDARLNQMIDNNKLTGSEIVEIPIGREIVYYA